MAYKLKKQDEEKEKEESTCASLDQFYTVNIHSYTVKKSNVFLMRHCVNNDYAVQVNNRIKMGLKNSIHADLLTIDNDVHN